MLEPWAIQHKRWKKTVAWRLYQKRDLSSAALHHATSETEAANLRAKELGAPVCVVANGIDLPQRADRGADPRDGIMTAVFLGRIYPVKGLPMLIEAWRRAMPKGWRLVIAGPDEAGHKSEVERAVAGAGLGAVVSFRGPVGGEEKRRLMSEADLFVLPTHSESFGLAIAEALSFGLPVLTTTAAPWPLLEQENCGWRVTPDADSLANGLSHATSLDRSALGEMGMRGRDIMGSRYRWDSVADQFLEQYERISG
jgi:glycosyltransferase involved in cell wall biosynthesis